MNAAAVGSKAPVVVQDVRKDPRYLQTFGSTGSELIYPVLDVAGEVVGTIDVESEKFNAFSDGDVEMIENCAEILVPLWGKSDAGGVDE